jgi:MarR family
MRARAELGLQHFVEETGLFYEQAGLPRMAGRILGWLLVCEPAEQSMAELARALRGSKASMSTMTRLLVQLGLVERTRLPGARTDHFRIRPEMWADTVKARLDTYRRGRELADRGLAALSGRPPQVRARLQSVRDMYAWYEIEMPRLVARFEREQATKPRKRDA